MRVLRFAPALAALVLLALPSSVRAQAILVVDAQQGPGTQFTDIPPAIAAAAPGDRIVVRAGVYTGFTVDKPLSIVASTIGTAMVMFPGAGQAAFAIEDLPSGTDFVMRGLSFATLGSTTMRDCAGRILLEDVVNARPLLIERCDQVMLNQCQLTWTTTITDATVTMSECTARGNLFSGAGLLISSSAVHLARTAVTGGSLKGGGPGIVMFGATVTVAGDASTVIAAAPPPAPPGSSAIGGTGTLTIDPDVVLTATGGAPSIEPGVAVATAELPTLAAAGAPLGGALQIDLRGESADLFVLLAGVPAAALPVPALRGELWIAPATALPVASGSLGVSAIHSVSFPVPIDPGFIGVHLGWIGVAGASFADLRFTNNASHTISAD